MKSLKKLKIEHVVLFVIGALFIMFLVNSYNGSLAVLRDVRRRREPAQDSFRTSTNANR